MSNYYLGIDGGGTKTKAVIVDDEGTVVAEGAAGGSNIHNVSDTVLIDNLIGAVKEAVKNAGESVRFERAVLGLAGLDTKKDMDRLEKVLEKIDWEELRCGSVVVVNDAYVGLRGYTDSDFGVCLISGTGSAVYGVNKDGKEAKAGDWGYLVGDQGSGFGMGKKLLEEVVREFDGRSARSVLTERVLERWQVDSVENLLGEVYKSPEIDVTRISDTAKVLTDEEVLGLGSVQEIVRNAVDELASAYGAVLDRMDWGVDDEFPVVLIGGMFRIELFYEWVKGRVLEMSPEVEVISDQGRSAHGAAGLALDPPKVWPKTAVEVR